jgi:ribosomal protein S12 methylthiotransferase accessory factor
MQIEITFPGGDRVDASIGPHTVKTDQPSKQGGVGSAPTPFAHFLASIGTCAGIYVLNFMRQRGLDVEGVRLIQQVHREHNTGRVSLIELSIDVPENFPEKYRAALIRTVELCSVKKHLEQPPEFAIQVQTARVPTG